MTRPSKYATHVQPRLDDVERWWADGYDLSWIAKQLGVARSSLMLYKKDYPDLSDALKKGEAKRIENMASRARSALFDKLGDRMVTVEETVEAWTDSTGKSKGQHKVQKKRLVLADTTAVIFALKSYKPEQYRDQTFAGLNKAQTEKAKADAQLAQLKAKEATGNDEPITVEVVMPPGSDDADKEAEADAKSDD